MCIFFLFSISYLKAHVIGRSLFISGDSILTANDLKDIDKDKIDNIVIEEGIYEIQAHCFKGFDYLQRAKLPKSIENFDPTVFDDCLNLVEVTSAREDEFQNQENPQIIEEKSSSDFYIPSIFPWILSAILFSLLILVLSYYGEELDAKKKIIKELREREKTSNLDQIEILNDKIENLQQKIAYLQEKLNSDEEENSS